MIALLFAVALPAQVCDVNGLYPTTEIPFSTSVGVPSGTNFCYDIPTNSVCHYASGGSMFGEANSLAWEYDGTILGGDIQTLRLTDAALTWDIRPNGAAGSLSMYQGAVERWRFFINSIAHSAGNGPEINNAALGIANVVYEPHRSDGDTGISGDGADTLGLVAGGTVATWDGTEFFIPETASINDPSLRLNSGGADTGLNSNASGNRLYFVVNGLSSFAFDNAARFRGLASSGPGLRNSNAAIGNATILPDYADATAGLAGDGAGTLSLVGSSTPATWDGANFDLNPTGSRYGMSISGGTLQFYRNGGVRAQIDAEGTKVDDEFGTLPSATQSLLATDQLLDNSGTVQVVGNGGAVTLTSNPQIPDGFDGQELIIIGTSETNTVEVVDGNGLRLAGDVDFIFGEGDTMYLKYSGTVGDWIEISRSDN